MKGIHGLYLMFSRAGADPAPGGGAQTTNYRGRRYRTGGGPPERWAGNLFMPINRAS